MFFFFEGLGLFFKGPRGGGPWCGLGFIGFFWGLGGLGDFELGGS